MRRAMQPGLLVALRMPVTIWRQPPQCSFSATRQEPFDALTAGLAGGAFAVIPGIFLYLSLTAFYPAITRAPVPAISVLQRIDSPTFSLIFQVALFVTFVKTGVGLLHALNERIASAFAARRAQMPRFLRPVAASAILGFAIFIADRFGIVALVAKGYGSITSGFLIIYVLPVLTIGSWRVWRAWSALAAPQPIATRS